jgi:hypothetical protein
VKVWLGPSAHPKRGPLMHRSPRLGRHLPLASPLRLASRRLRGAICLVVLGLAAAACGSAGHPTTTSSEVPITGITVTTTTVAGGTTTSTVAISQPTSTQAPPTTDPSQG